MRAFALAFALGFIATAALAQYKWIDADGRVGFGDKPPPGAHDIESLQGVQPGARTPARDALPYELKRAVSRFPVTLYTTGDCPGCAAGRDLLRQRGVPYSEKSLSSAAEAAALKGIAGSDKLPVLQVGSKTLTGFNSAQWTEALDGAEYPAQSRLPADWSWEPARPMIERKPPAAPEPAAPSAQPAPGAGQ